MYGRSKFDLEAIVEVVSGRRDKEIDGAAVELRVTGYVE